jgi:hypothetical protein
VTRQKLEVAPPSATRSTRKRVVIDLATIDLRAGDEVAARNDDTEYEVGAIEALQGRVQVADTRGHVHTYHENEKVRVIRLG